MGMGVSSSSSHSWQSLLSSSSVRSGATSIMDLVLRTNLNVISASSLRDAFGKLMQTLGWCRIREMVLLIICRCLEFNKDVYQINTTSTCVIVS